MPIVELPSNVKLDPLPAGVVELPHDAQVDKPQPPGFLAGLVHAIGERGAGLAQLGARMGAVDPSAAPYLPPDALQQLATGRAVPQLDKDVRQFQQDYARQRQAGGSSASTKAGELVGGLGADAALSAPLAAIPGAGGFVAGLLRGAGIGAAAGAAGGAVAPVTDTGHFGRRKAEQIATGGATGAVVGGVLGSLGGVLARDDPAEAERIIRSSYYRGVRPPAAMTAPERGVYDARVRQAIDAVLDTRAGRPPPRTPEEFSQGIAEAKQAVFQRYSAMERAAEQAGARVRLQPAADRLRQLTGDPLADPAAKSEAERLLKLIPGGNPFVAPTRADEITRFLSDRAGEYGQTAKGAAAAFRAAADTLRQDLVRTVEGAGQANYGAARRTYGSLASIEDHVGAAAGRELRANGSALGLSEIGAAGMVGAGEPAGAAAIEGGKLFTRWLKSPNRAVRKLFDTAASLRRAPSATERLGAAIPAATPGAATMPPELLGLRDRIGALRQQQQDTSR